MLRWPTDAALSAAVINDERLPIRLRRSLNVESGLNDGIATSLVTVMLAIAASQLGEAGGSEAFQAGTALRELGVGVQVGAGSGIDRASAVIWAHDERGSHQVVAGSPHSRSPWAPSCVRGRSAETGSSRRSWPASRSTPCSHPRSLTSPVRSSFRSSAARVLTPVVWFLFGGALAPIALGDLDARLVLYALLGLAHVRMAPVGLAMLRSGLDRSSVA